MNIRKRFNAGELKHEAILWMIIGPIMLFHLFFMGFGAFLLIPVCVAYAVLSLLLFLRTLNFGYLVKANLFMVLLVFLSLILLKAKIVLVFFAAIAALMVLTALIILIVQGYYRWKTTALFELAAMPVKEVKNGYTGRPLPVGKISYKWDELIRFSKFIRQNLISVVYFDTDKVVFGLNHSKFKLVTFDKEYTIGSWVSFDKQGNISVHISSNDYQKYKDAYAFDQLCENLGKLYQEFFSLHKNHKEKEILKRLNLTRIN